ncbi:MAG: formate dehydrogenase accessory sulfurtransferase FdhD [Dehalococcoidales bacterium]|nr:formate dehydrogenase accessory sulfurtransferase FdhD [Dehalococcoidales bacterium]
MIKKLPILRINEGKASEVEDTVVAEHSATIFLNNQQVVTVLCSPVKLDYLAIGFLLSEGLIKTKEDVLKTSVSGDESKSQVYVEAKAGGKIRNIDTPQMVIASSGGKFIPSGVSYEGIEQKITSKIKITPAEIIALMEKFHRRSPVFTATGGVHSVALCDNENVLAFSDDIGRHNTMDRLFGECLMKGISAGDHIVITSGRVSSEIMSKVARRSVPIIMSVSAPTDVAVELADRLSITLIGFVRGNKMNVYTHNWRVVLHDS